MVPDKKGVTPLARLEDVERRTGKRPALLDGPPFPQSLEYVWEWFDELSDARRTGDFGVASLTYSDIDAWARLTGQHPSPYDVRLLIDLDRTYRKAIHDGRPRPD